VDADRRQPTSKSGQQAGNGRWADDPLALPNVRGTKLSLPALHPEIQSDRDAARSWLSQLPRPWAVDLFSGCGGLGLGLERGGFNVVAAADSDPTALETYAANLDALTWCGDLSDPAAFVGYLADLGVQTVDAVAGGPPCQPFSRAGSSKIRSLVADGSRESEDTRVELWRSFMAVVDALTPEAVLLENVPDMASWDDGSILHAIIQSLLDCGYVTDARVLQAERHGVPQHRQRLFVIGRRSGAFSWPRPSGAKVDLEAAIGDLPAIDAGNRDLVRPYERPKSPFQIRARSGMPRGERSVVHDHISRAVREDDAEAFALLKPGQTYRELPDKLKRYRDDIFDDKYKRLSWDSVSRTITAHMARDGYWYIHPDQPRTLSIREAARLQTFPDVFRFCGHPSVQYRQIGNAVPPVLGEAVARRVKAALESEEPARSSTFDKRLRAWHSPVPSEHGQTAAWRILVQELCLSRQTQAEQQPLLDEALALAPTPAAASAQTVALVELVGPRAAVRLLAVAKAMCDFHDGQVPESAEALRALPGVGTHAAAVVRCFGFGQLVPLSNQGVRRIIERVTGQSTSSVWTNRLQVVQLAGTRGPDVAFNAGLLRLAGEYCLPSRPLCGDCPVRPECSHGSRSSRGKVTAGEGSPKLAVPSSRKFAA
jgi:DNA (cytosine-5)-methyltransferase 1